MDEIVETSDPEELEELRAALIRPAQHDGPLSPRKRQKLHHDYDEDSPSSLPATTPPISVTDSSVVVRDADDPLTDADDVLSTLGIDASPKFHPSPDTDTDALLVPETNPPTTPGTSQRARSESVDPLLLFTPSRPSISEPDPPRPSTPPNPMTSFSLPPSPLSPLPSQRQPSSPPRDPSPSREPTPPIDPDLMNMVDMDMGQRTRMYSLRERRPQQLNPYRIEKKLYETTMRNVPEAIVKIRSPKRRERREDNYEETQEVPSDREPEAGPSRSEEKEIPEWMKGWFDSTPGRLFQEGSGSHSSRTTQREKGKEEIARKLNKKTIKPFPVDSGESPKQQQSHSKSPARRRVSQQPPSPGTPTISLPPTPLFQDAPLPDAMELPDSFSLPSSPRVQAADPIVISDDEDNEPSRVGSRASSPSREFLTEAEKKQRKRLRALKLRRRRQRYASSESDEQPLLPGQTRVRRAKTGILREVKGDTESSAEEIPEATRGDEFVDRDDRRSASEAEDAGLPKKGRTRTHIEDYLQEAPMRGAGLREKDMIDWMLANTAEVGGARRRRRRTKKPAGSRSKVSAPRQRQTQLSVDKQPQHGRSRARSPRRAERSASPPPRSSHIVHHHHHIHMSPRASSTSRRADTPQRNDQYASGGDDIVAHPEISRKAARKQREKEKRARMKMNGIHIFLAPKGNRIEGQHTTKTFTLDVADHGFHAALAPAKSNKRVSIPRQPPKPRPPRPRRVAKPHVSKKKQQTLPLAFFPPEEPPSRPESPAVEEGVVNDDSYFTDLDSDEEEPVLLDFGISASSISFDIRTYTGKGFLAELVDLQVPTTPVSEPSIEEQTRRETFRPNYFSTMEFDLGPTVTVDQFLSMFGKICDRFFDFATGLPEEEEGEAAREWTSVIGATCRLLTWLLSAKETTEEEMRALKDAAETHVLRLASKMTEADLKAQSMDSTTFAALLALHAACTMLVEQLLKYGLQQGMAPLVSPPDRLDGSTTAQRVFELWVGLWIIAGKHSSSVHPVWKMVQTTLMAHHLEGTHFEDSELVWQAIISLSTISNLCREGKVTGLSRLGTDCPAPTCWEMVTFALGRISLEAKTGDDDSLDTHDRYIKIVVERWNWELHDAFDALFRLNVIFQSRKYANLRNEPAEFPDFLRLDDWTLLSGRKHRETAFVLFLKLVYQTLLVNPSKAKKLLSLATPVGSLPWSKAQPPSVNELAMLFNRLGVIAIAIHVDPKQHSRFLGLARDYVKFKDVDATTRQAYIRGFMYLSIVMIRRAIPLDETLNWLHEMVDVLLDEYKRQPSRTVVVGLHSLVVSVRDPPNVPPQYPEPRLLLALERILRDVGLIKPDNPTAHILPRLIQAFLAARELAVPPPRRPALPAVEQESQDDYGMSLDDVFMEYLDQEDAEYKAKDKILYKLLETNISWTLFRLLVQFCRYDQLKQRFKTTGDSVSNDIAHLIWCWVSCGNIVTHSSARSWSQFLSAFGPNNEGNKWPILDDFCQRRLDFLVYNSVLQLDPMTYSDLTLRDRLLVVLFEALASWYTSAEDEYIARLLNFDGCRHPLLLGAAAPLPQDDASEEERLTARLPLLTVIVENLSTSLTDIYHEENDRYVRYCIKLFAAMKNIYLELDGDSRQSYKSWCLKVYEVFKGHSNIVEDNKVRLGHHWTWLQSLNV
ncbi:Mus7/MMS22 family-domain-containing protein [Roridomyces roridus]|uniref:Mus7/MMS22 family-domain-containing protein n=1 Tax=Roridomyces roridus TaxID=1738132 RepID=A0AAD7BKI2_9AGAR|nr:Mus7/MMS22 family-domain-containing protein [Roridomyces roridus]